MKYFLQDGEAYREIEVQENSDHLLVRNAKDQHTVQLTALENGYYSIIVNNRNYLVKADVNSRDILMLVNHRERKVRVLDRRQKLEAELFGAAEEDAHSADIRAPMPGMVLRVEVKPGDAVEVGQPLVVMEAMKMENEIRAVDAGIVKKVAVQPQQAVEKDDLLISLEE